MVRMTRTLLAGLTLGIGMALSVPAASALTNPALEFNGTSDFVELTTTSATSLLNGYTLEAWAYPTTSSLAHRILSNFQLSPNRGFGFGIRDRRWRLTTFGIKDYDTANDVVTTGVWTHLAISLDSQNTARVYVNGALHTVITHNQGARESTHTLNIGRNPTGTEYWQGRIDEIRIWDHVRTPAQIAKHWNRTLTGTELGLIGYYPFNEGTGTTTEDVSPNNGDGTLVGCTWVEGPPLLEPMTDADSEWLEQP